MHSRRSLEYFSRDTKISKLESRRKIENLYPFIIRRPEEDELVNFIWLDYRLNYPYEFNSLLFFFVRILLEFRNARNGAGDTDGMEIKRR